MTAGMSVRLWSPRPISFDQMMRVLSSIVPLLARLYPNGGADVNHFQAAGGMGFLIRELLSAGLLHADADSVMGGGLAAQTQAPSLIDGQLCWREAPAAA